MTLRSLRTLVAAVLVLDLVVMLAFSVSKQTLTRTTSEPLPQSPVRAQPAAPTAALPTTQPAIPTSAPPVIVAGPVATSSPAAPPTGRASAPPTPSRTVPAPSGGTGESIHPAACPIEITDETPTAGGLQSLISFAPAFGEFSAEAFAMASAYQPVLQLLGPILAQYPSLAPKLAPFVVPFVDDVQRVMNTLYALVAPIYAPYRQRVLNAETKLAAALEPYAHKLASSVLGGCLIDLETALVQDTKTGIAAS